VEFIGKNNRNQRLNCLYIPPEDRWNKKEKLTSYLNNDILWIYINKGAIMTATISTWGNSQGLRFPKDIMNQLSLSIGDKVRIFVENHKIVLEPVKPKRKKIDIKNLVKDIPLEYNASEVFNYKIGKEEW
jgi:antitoxin MazE